jgi:hypothetical protein
LTDASEAAPYFVGTMVPTPRNFSVTYNGVVYSINGAGKIQRGTDPASDLCLLPDAYMPISEGNEDGIAVDAQYVYGLFNDGYQEHPVLLRCRINGTPDPTVLFGDRQPATNPSAPFGAFGGIRDTSDALYWGARDTEDGPIIVYRLVR